MKERPILFSGEMVKAILEGRKTETRRIMKIDSPTIEFDSVNPPWPTCEMKNGFDRVPCKYGIIGDRLWVRESFYCVDMPDYGDCPCLIYQEEFDTYQKNNPHNLPQRPCIYKFGHHPSIHMPRWASRITLEITNIRVERLNDISEEDCIKEGIYVNHVESKLIDRGAVAKYYFKNLWESIYGLGSWGKNSWVWVIEFRKI